MTTTQPQQPDTPGSKLRTIVKALASIAGAATLLAHPVHAKPASTPGAWPAKPVRVVVPFGAGGVADIVIRPTLEKLARSASHAFVVDNRPGAGGSLGAGIVAKAAPDGHQLLFTPGSVLSMNPHLYAKVPFTPESFAPVSLVADMGVILVVRSKLAFNNVQDLLAAEKADPGKLLFASPGAGSSLHLAIELFSRTTGAALQHIGYKSGGEAATAVLSAQAAGLFANLPLVLPHIKAGTMRPLLVSGKTRLPQLPDVPASAEVGLAGFDLSSWFGLVAPAGTPRPLVDHVASQIAQALREPDLAQRFADQGVRVIAAGPDPFGQFLQQDRARWGSVIRAAKIRLE